MTRWCLKNRGEVVHVYHSVVIHVVHETVTMLSGACTQTMENPDEQPDSLPKWKARQSRGG